MAIKKEYSKDKTICRVTFTLPKDIAEQFHEIAVVGDFNDWGSKVNRFAVTENDVHGVSVELETNKEYQFRYLGNGEVWLNETEADKTVSSPYGESKNSVIIV